MIVIACFLVCSFLTFACGKRLPSEVQFSEHPYVSQRKVCYPEVGCFDNGAPFSYLPNRPLPPPQDPALLKPYLKIISLFEPGQDWEIPLIGEFNVSLADKNATHHPSALDLTRTFRAFSDFTFNKSEDLAPGLDFLIGCTNDDDDVVMELARYFANIRSLTFVFGVHNESGSELQNLSNLRSLGVSLARFLKFLQVEYNLSNKLFSLYGVGCGAHLAGYVGERVLVNRTTGFDPSSYMFEDEDPVVRLDRSDAGFVDVIHTDAMPSINGLHGYMQPIGHVDFYVNGGFRQHNCSVSSEEEDNPCNHYASIEYFKMTFKTLCQFWAHNISMESFTQTLSNNDKGFGVRRGFVSLNSREACNLETCTQFGTSAILSPVRGIQLVTMDTPICPRSDKLYEGERNWLANVVSEDFLKWLHSIIPSDYYKDSAVPVLPPIPPKCFPVVGCFNMTSPWTVMKSRPISIPDPPSMQKIEAWLFTRENFNKRHTIPLFPKIPKQLVGETPFNASKMTFFLIHGFYNSGNEPWIGEMKEALLLRTDCNVFVGNWGNGSLTLDYLQAAGNLRLASRLYSNLLQFYVDQKGLNVTKVHLIGHSLGAHIAGLIGKSIPGIFQITALDPAQPWFQAANNSVRITKDDADFVVGVHSDASPFIPDLGFGLAREVGHVDFYINGAFKQPKCSQPHNTEPMWAPKFTNVLDMLKPVSELFVRIALCPHQAAVEIFTEAIASRHCIFWGQAVKVSNMIAASLRTRDKKVSSLQFKAATDVECTPTTCSPLGLDTYFWNARGTFVVLTKDFPPYCIYSSHVRTLQRTRYERNHMKWRISLKSLMIIIGLRPMRAVQLLLSYIVNKLLPLPFISFTEFFGNLVIFSLPVQVTIHYLYQFGAKAYDRMKSLLLRTLSAVRLLLVKIYIYFLTHACLDGDENILKELICFTQIWPFVVSSDLPNLERFLSFSDPYRHVQPPNTHKTKTQQNNLAPMKPVGSKNNTKGNFDQKILSAPTPMKPNSKASSESNSPRKEGASTISLIWGFAKTQVQLALLYLVIFAVKLF